MLCFPIQHPLPAPATTAASLRIITAAAFQCLSLPPGSLCVSSTPLPSSPTNAPSSVLHCKWEGRHTDGAMLCTLVCPLHFSHTPRASRRDCKGSCWCVRPRRSSLSSGSCPYSLRYRPRVRKGQRLERAGHNRVRSWLCHPEVAASRSMSISIFSLKVPPLDLF